MIKIVSSIKIHLCAISLQELIKKVEFGTSSLKERITAANKMFEAGYKIGLNIAPIIYRSNIYDLWTT